MDCKDVKFTIKIRDVYASGGLRELTSYSM